MKLENNLVWGKRVRDCRVHITDSDRAFELLEFARQANQFKTAKSKDTFLTDPDFSAIKADDRFNQFVSEPDQTETRK